MSNSIEPQATSIGGLYKIDYRVFNDYRGQLIKPFSTSFLSPAFFDHKLPSEVWFTKSHRNVIRAMHMQVGPHACSKIVSVIQGAVLDVVIDLRKDSPTFKSVYSTVLSAGDISSSLVIPIGCAHGYKVLMDNTVTMYAANEVHDSSNDVGIHWNSFGFDWALDEEPIISERDQALPHLLTII